MLPDDHDATRTRIVVLAKLGNYTGALTHIRRIDPPAERRALAFEEAYCLYRSGKLDEALALINDADQPLPRRLRILRAQLVRSDDEVETGGGMANQT